MAGGGEVQAAVGIDGRRWGGTGSDRRLWVGTGSGRTRWEV